MKKRNILIIIILILILVFIGFFLFKKPTDARRPTEQATEEPLGLSVDELDISTEGQ